MRNFITAGVYPPQLAGHKGLRRELSRTIGATSQKLYAFPEGGAQPLVSLCDLHQHAPISTIIFLPLSILKYF